ncbi:cytokinesis protein 3, partial [Rhizopus stolonifer]
VPDYRISLGNNETQTSNRPNYTHNEPIIHQKIHRKPVPALRAKPQSKGFTVSPIKINSQVERQEALLPPSGIQYEKKENKFSFQDLNVVRPVEKNANFWYPRTGKENEPLKRSISKKIRELLQPHRTQLEEASKFQHEADSKMNLCRSKTPQLGYEHNPFRILRYTSDMTDKTRLHFQESHFAQIDIYASTVQQRGPLLTPTILSQKFLVRPYKRDLFRLRALFIWIVQNIRPEYHQKRNDLILLQKQQAYLIQYQKQIEKPSLLKQKLSKTPQEEENEPCLMDKLDSIDLLQEEALLLATHFRESPEKVLGKRTCQSAFGMAHLFTDMAIAAGFEDTQVVYGYLKGCYREEQPLPINHAWCAVNIEGEYRFIDCWMASPFHPHNDNKMEPHWFLTEPLDMIMTHLPEKRKEQHLSRSITHHAFFSVPYVRNVFFWHKMFVIDYITHQSEEDGIIYISIQMLPETSCYVEIEAENGIVARGLAQCFKDENEDRLCKIKAVLPIGHTQGWLKIYAGPKALQNGSNLQVIQKNHYKLALCMKVTADQPSSGFDFVKLHTDHNDFYIQEPQCYQLYPLQTYHFTIKGSRPSYRATHHKLAIKSPNGKLHKLMYQPQDQLYEAAVKVSGAGKWSLICLLHHTGGWYTVAEWRCSIPE